MATFDRKTQQLKGQLRVEELNDYCVTICSSKDWMVEMDFAGVYYVKRRKGQKWELFRATRSAELMVETWNARAGVDAAPVVA